MGMHITREMKYALYSTKELWNKPGALCNIGYPSETHLTPKSHKISCAHNACLHWPIVLKFYTEHDSITAVFCVICQNVWKIETDVMDERNFARFEFKMSFGRISPGSIFRHISVNVMMVSANQTGWHVYVYSHWLRSSDEVEMVVLRPFQYPITSLIVKVLRLRTRAIWVLNGSIALNLVRFIGSCGADKVVNFEWLLFLNLGLRYFTKF